MEYALRPFLLLRADPPSKKMAINYFNRGQVTRRYGFDLGFMTKLLKDTFVMKKSVMKKVPALLSHLKKVSKGIFKKLILRNWNDLEKKYYQLFSLVRLLERILRSKKCIEVWLNFIRCPSSRRIFLR